jgi:hypothetical protein
MRSRYFIISSGVRGSDCTGGFPIASGNRFRVIVDDRRYGNLTDLTYGSTVRRTVLPSPRS